MKEVDWPGGRKYGIHDVPEVLSRRVRVARVEAEPDFEIAQRLPQLHDRVHPARYGVVPTSGILDQNRDGGHELLEDFSPPIEAPPNVVLGMARVHDHCGRLDLLGP